MKRIRFFINTLEAGGAEKVLVNLINVLPRDKFYITLVTISGGTFVKDLPNWINYRQIMNDNNSILSKLLKKIVYHLPRVIFNYIFLNGEYDYEIAFMHGYPTKIMNYKCKNKSDKTKVYAFVHSNLMANNTISSLYRNINECIAEYKQFDKVCFVSKMAMDGFFKKFGLLNNAIIIHNIIDCSNIIEKSHIKSVIKFTTNGLKIITVGRLNKVKAFDRLIRISQKLEDIYEFEIIIVGEGDEKINLQKLINDLKVHSVKLVGFHKNPYCIIKQADIYICSSITEGYSTSVSEAIVLGKPVLTTNCAGMDEILDNGKFGIICNNNEESLLEKLEMILKNQQILNKYIKNIQCIQNNISNKSKIGDYSKIL